MNGMVKRLGARGEIDNCEIGRCSYLRSIMYLYDKSNLRPKDSDATMNSQ